MMLASFCLTLLTLNSTVTVIDEAVVPAKSANVSSTTSVTEPAENTTTAAAADKVAPQEAAAGEGALSASPTAHGVAEQAVQAWLLRYQFQDGQKLRYQTTQKMTLDATRGQKREVDLSELRQRRVFTVLSVDADQSARIAMQFENVWMRSKAGDREAVEFNSNMKPGMVPPAFRQVAHELKGSAPKYWLSATGVSMYPVAKKPSVAKSQESVNDAAESVIDLVEGESTNSKIQLVSKTNHGLTQQEEKNLSDPGSFLMTLPEDEIKIGDTWKETISIPVRLQADVNIQVPILRTFRLESVEDGIAKITFRCSAQSPIKNVTVATQLIQATPRGVITFDINRGLMLRREMRYDESVFGAFGAESLLTSVGTNVEEYISGDTKNED